MNSTNEPKMKSGIRKRGQNSYEISVSLGRDTTTGKYLYHWENVKGTKKDAEKRRNELLHELNSGAFVKPGKATVDEYLERWLTDYAKPNLSPRGFERYAGIVRQHLIPELGNTRLTQLKPEHIQRHYSAMLSKGRSASTIKYHHAVIHKALQTAIRWGLVSRNAADGVDVPRSRRGEMHIWDDWEVRRFLETAKDSPYYALFHTALFTGMRRSELLALRWRDIDVQKIHVSRSLHHLKDGSYVFTQPKSAKSRRSIDLSPSSMLRLAEHKDRQEGIAAMQGRAMAHEDLVFSTLTGQPLRPNTITRAWHNLAVKAEVRPIRLHDARHTHASLMLKQGVHPKIVQERLGHASIEMTLDIYSHVTPGLQRQAAEAFDQLLNPGPENGPVESTYW